MITFSARVRVVGSEAFWNREMPRNGLFIFEHLELLLSQFLAVYPSVSLSLFNWYHPPFSLACYLFFVLPLQPAECRRPCRTLARSPLSDILSCPQIKQNTGLRKRSRCVERFTNPHRTRKRKKNTMGGKRNRNNETGEKGGEITPVSSVR
ncbi:hypothetical protein LZ31DRAFT_264489 [Colletotrichum somersetense]|nr:hypothetical protein LZ31DRAFT_264489 [Colletotrichum somersetense]